MTIEKRRWQSQQGFKLILAVALAAIAALVFTPSWADGYWPWGQPLEAHGIAQVKAIAKTSLPLPGWEVSSHGTVPINGQEWGLSEYVPASTADQSAIGQVGLLILPQSWHDDQPTVEWVDLRGAQNWRIANATNLRVTAGASQVRARYFQARTDQRTFAVLQWYAWPGGGDFAPGHWFWVDQLSQWRRGQRTPWVAVCLLLPIQPLGDISVHAETASQLAQAVQSALMTTAFTQSNR